MKNASVSVGFGTGDSDTELIIEQGEPEDSDGYLSTAAMYLTIWDLLEGNELDEPDCIDDCMHVDLFVYRTNLALPYWLGVTHGVLGERIVQNNVRFVQKIKLSLEDEFTLNYPCFGVISGQWLGQRIWDEDGNQTTAPGYVVNGRKGKLTKKVYGTFLLTYIINRDAYRLIVDKRVDAEENKYSCVAYAIHNGGPTWETVDPPPLLEETDRQCTGGGGTVNINPLPEDPDGPPYAPNVDAKTTIDYCTQEILSETP